MKALLRTARAILEELKDSIKIAPSFPLRHLAAIQHKEFEFTIGGGAKCFIRPQTSDAETIRQVFRDKEYDLSRFPQWPSIQSRYRTLLDTGRKPVIIDAGANIGAASLWFSMQFPDAIIFAVEPDPHNARQCRRNTAAILNITVFECAVGATDGRVALSNPDNEAWAVQTSRLDNDGEGIAIRTLASLLDAVPDGELFIAKIDIEGFEADLFSKNCDWARTATVIYIEPHDWMPTTRRSSLNFQLALAPFGKEILISGENLVYVNST